MTDRERNDHETMETYHATVDVARKADTVDEDTVDEVMKLLVEFGPSMSSSLRGWASASISLPAETLAQACATAVAVVSAAYGAPAIATEVMTEKELDATERFVVAKAARLFGVSRQAVPRQITAKTVPTGRISGSRDHGENLQDARGLPPTQRNDDQ